MATATLHLTVSDTAGRRSVTVSASPFSIGRSSENELQLTDAQVSRRHAELVESADGWRVRDCGSRFGTFVNDARVEETAVTIGDRIRLGQTELRLEMADASSTVAGEGAGLP